MIVRGKMGIRWHCVSASIAGLFALGCGGEPRSESLETRREGLTLGLETALDPQEIAGPISGHAELPWIASNGSDYLGVWCASNLPFDNTRYAARLSADGALLDDPPLVVDDSCVGSTALTRPAVTHGASGYVIVHTVPVPGGYDLQSALVKSDGSLVQNGIIVSAPETESAPGLASSGGALLLVWADDRNNGNNDIYARRLDSTGKTVGNEIALTNTPQNETNPSVVFDGSNYLVAWEDVHEIYGRHVTPLGAVVEASPLVLVAGGTGFPNAPVLAFNGTNVMLAHEMGQKLNVRRLAGDGSLVGTALDVATGIGTTHAIASNGADFFVAWTQGGTGPVRGMRIAANGTPLDPTTSPSGIPLSLADGEDPALGGNGTGYLAAWTGEVPGVDTENALAVGVSSAGTVGTPKLFSRIANRQSQPAAAFDGTEHLVVWKDFRATGGFDVYGTRVSANGTVLDAPSVPLVTAAGDQENLALAFGVDAHVMTWTAADELFAANITPQGSAGPSTLLSSSASSSDVAFGGSGFLVAYAAGYSAHALRVGLDGAPVGPDLDLDPTSTSPVQAPAVAWGGYYLAAWSNSDGTKAVRIAADGTVIDPTPILIATEAEIDAFFSLGPPAVAFGDGVFLVVFHEILSRTYAKRVSLEGVVLDAKPIELPDLDTNTHQPSVRFDGTDFVVAYGCNPQGVAGINVVRVGTNGIVSSEQDDFPASEPGAVTRTLRVSSECGGNTLLVYSREGTTGIQTNERAFARVVTPDVVAPSPSCTIPAELAPPVGGAGGSAGSAGSGNGGTGVGGASGSGATGGSFGGAAGTAGSGGKGDGTAGRPVSDDGGCGCRSATSTRVSLWPFAILAVALMRRRRRRTVRRSAYRARSGQELDGAAIHMQIFLLTSAFWVARHAERRCSRPLGFLHHRDGRRARIHVLGKRGSEAARPRATLP